jgi:hypothetical protein
MQCFVVEKYDNRCPICDADMHGLAECDHFTRVDRADKDNCWIICRACNRSLGNVGGIFRNDIEPAYFEWRRRFDLWMAEQSISQTIKFQQ